MNNVKPYTYIISNGFYWYIGYRCANKVPAQKDSCYQSSSKNLKKLMKVLPDTWRKEILGEYDTALAAAEAERIMLDAFWDNIGRVNKNKAGVYDYADLDIRQKMLNTINSPEGKLKRSKTQVECQNRPDVKAEKSKKAKMYFADPDKKQSHLEKMNSPEIKKKISDGRKGCLAWNKGLKLQSLSAEHKAKLSKPCTIDDGITIFMSRRALGEALGFNKTGVDHPNFKYLIKKD